jgi:hypothetical protein
MNEIRITGNVEGVLTDTKRDDDWNAHSECFLLGSSHNNRSSFTLQRDGDSWRTSTRKSAVLVQGRASNSRWCERRTMRDSEGIAPWFKRVIVTPLSCLFCFQNRIWQVMNVLNLLAMQLEYVVCLFHCLLRDTATIPWFSRWWWQLRCRSCTSIFEINCLPPGAINIFITFFIRVVLSITMIDDGWRSTRWWSCRTHFDFWFTRSI